jgi:hypothetical protein
MIWVLDEKEMIYNITNDVCETNKIPSTLKWKEIKIFWDGKIHTMLEFKSILAKIDVANTLGVKFKKRSNNNICRFP